MIRFVKNSEIDKAKWDAAIERSCNRVIYALSWYLDNISPQWCALIEDDYVSCMPLPIKRNILGLPIIRKPLFSTFLGIFSSSPIDVQTTQLFLKAIPFSYPYIKLPFNELNIIKESHVSQELVTFILDLSNDYETIQRGYSNHTAKYINKAYMSEVVVKKAMDFDDVMKFFARTGSTYAKPQYKEAMRVLFNHTECDVYKAYIDASLVSVYVFVKSFENYIFLTCTTRKAGRKAYAHFALVNAFIKEKSGSKAYLDFDGSPIVGLAKFYAGFGAKKHYFRLVKMINFPFLRKL